jgi:hypothetical protein
METKAEEGIVWQGAEYNQAGGYVMEAIKRAREAGLPEADVTHALLDITAIYMHQIGGDDALEEAIRRLKAFRWMFHQKTVQ